MDSVWGVELDGGKGGVCFWYAVLWCGVLQNGTDLYLPRIFRTATTKIANDCFGNVSTESAQSVVETRQRKT